MTFIYFFNNMWDAYEFLIKFILTFSCYGHVTKKKKKKKSM